MAAVSPHLVHLFDTFDVGETQLRTARTINALGDRYRHTIVSMDRGTTARQLIDARVDVGVIGPLEGRYLGLPRLLDLLDPDLMLLNVEGRAAALLAAARHPAPLILQIDEEMPAQRLRPRRIAAALLKKVALVVTTSDVCREALETLFEPFAIPVANVPMGLEPETGPPVAIPGLDRQPGELALGMMLSPRRTPGLGAILRAFKDAPNHRMARLVVFGYGPDAAPLAAQAEQLGIAERVVFLSDAGDVPALIRGCDLFAIVEHRCSSRHVALEAMAQGLPLIGIGAAGLHELVSEENREFLLPPDRGPALAARMDALLRSTQIRRRLGRGNLECARRFPLAPMIERYDSLFADLLGRR